MGMLEARAVLGELADCSVTILSFNSAGGVATATRANAAVLVMMKLCTSSDTPTSSNTGENSTRACSRALCHHGILATMTHQRVAVDAHSTPVSVVTAIEKDFHTYAMMQQAICDAAGRAAEEARRETEALQHPVLESEMEAEALDQAVLDTATEAVDSEFECLTLDRLTRYEHSLTPTSRPRRTLHTTMLCSNSPWRIRRHATGKPWKKHTPDPRL